MDIKARFIEIVPDSEPVTWCYLGNKVLRVATKHTGEYLIVFRNSYELIGSTSSLSWQTARRGGLTINGVYTLKNKAKIRLVTLDEFFQPSSELRSRSYEWVIFYKT